MTFWFKVLAFIFGIIFLINTFGPRETVDWTLSFQPDDIGDDPVAYLEEQEGFFDDIRDGAQKEIIWAGSKGAKTPLSIIYIHGFSASKQELRPVPDRIAESLGANLYFTRLTGHGRTGEAMAQATANDWLNDVAQAIAIGRRIGERVIIIATSQGGTMTAMSSMDFELMTDVAGIVFVSPNFRIKTRGSFVLTTPFSRSWVPMVMGEERSFEPSNEQHGIWWTTRYPTKALFPVAAAVEAAYSLPYDMVQTPALFFVSDKDEVVSAKAVREVEALWGGPSEVVALELSASDDPVFHVIAGDILSPSQNDPMVEKVLDWISSL